MSTKSLYAQSYQGNLAENFVMDSTRFNNLDTLGNGKKNKIRKPLTSSLFADSLKNSRVFMYNINLENATIDMAKVDTSLYDFEKNYIFLKKNRVGAAYIGPLGAAATSLEYEDRYNSRVNSFANVYGDYFFTPSNVDFYNVKAAFTQFEYFTAGQRQYSMEHLYVNHAQNISPSSSFDFKYQNNKKRAVYENQQAKNKNLSLNFAHTGKRYTLFMGFINNIADVFENGGVQDIGQITDTLIPYPETILTNLKAYNRIRGNQFYLTQSYSIPLKGVEIDSSTNFSSIPSLAIGTSINYSSYRKVYQDKYSTSADGYYDDWFFNSTETRDSIHEKHTDLSLFARYQPYNKYGFVGNITAGVELEKEQYYNFTPEDYISPNSNDKKSSFAVYGDIDGGYFQYLRWRGYLKYFLSGYRSQDLAFGGNVDFNFGKATNPLKIEAKVDITNTTPSYWAQNFVSNHYIWHNNFDKEFRTKFDFSFKMDKYNLELGFTQILDKNKVYYNAQSLPQQNDGTVSVTSIFAKKDFKAGNFHFNHRADVQLSSDQLVAPVPLLALNITYFYNIVVVKKVLNIHLGFDGYYNTKYYGYGYNPAIGQFYNQRDFETGSYPWFDVFAVGKWKRLRFILKMQHLNYGWGKNLNYISVADYPLEPRMFTFGFSWSFYD